MKVLIADDDAVTRDLLVDILTSANSGFDLLTAENGLKAWEVLETNPDLKLAIIDLSMPEIGGADWLGRVRGDPRFKQLPVIVCTGNTDRATVSSVAARGISNYLAKPFTRTAVLEKVWQVCKPPAAAAGVLRDVANVRQRLEIDRDTHLELLVYYMRLADAWGNEARRVSDFPKIRALCLRAIDLKQILTHLGAAALGTRFEEASKVLSLYRTAPLVAEMPACLRTVRELGDKLQPEIDRLREVTSTMA
jgi:two-component system, chemotaxis family, chemotaxis protein CheY